MKAIVQDQYGSPDVLRFEDIDQPVPGDGEVLVRVHAASVNARDWHMMRGDPYLARLMARATLAPVGPRFRSAAGTSPGGWKRSARGVTGSARATRCSAASNGAFAEYVCARGPVIGAEAGEPDVRAGGRGADGRRTPPCGLRDSPCRNQDRNVLINGASAGWAHSPCRSPGARRAG